MNVRNVAVKPSGDQIVVSWDWTETSISVLIVYHPLRYPEYRDIQRANSGVQVFERCFRRGNEARGKKSFVHREEAYFFTLFNRYMVGEREIDADGAEEGCRIVIL